MRIVLLASGEFALPTLRWLVTNRHDVPLVVTQPARPAGRGKRVAPTPVARASREFGLNLEEVENVNDPAFVTRLQSLRAQLGLVIAFGQKLGEGVLGAFPGGCINLHASLLPKYRGAAPINWAIVGGESKTGCTVFRITQRMDAGPILSSRWTSIKPEETAGELHDRLAGIGVDAVDAALQLYADAVCPEGTPQNEAEATKAPKLSKTDGFVRFDRPAVEVARHICGMTPWPGARAVFHGADGRWEQVSLARARRAEDPRPPTGPPGSLDVRCYVAAADGFVELLEIQPASGRLMAWPDYVNGRHVRPGDYFSTPQD